MSVRRIVCPQASQALPTAIPIRRSPCPSSGAVPSASGADGSFPLPKEVCVFDNKSLHQNRKRSAPSSPTTPLRPLSSALKGGEGVEGVCQDVYSL